ncbi:MAG: pre-peptidase C-terminal domain-containing protein [Gemmatimonadales bacterium]|nr:MAG: pre-peptidase C-terminal domain-containing protein [Gemmatimonadales bacterium]
MPSSERSVIRWGVLTVAGAAVAWAAACSPVANDESNALSLTLVDPPAQLLVGDTVRLQVQVTGGSVGTGASEVLFLSSDDSVIVAGPTGVLTAVGEGRAEITARLARWESAPPATHSIYVSRGIVIAQLAGARSRAGDLRFGEELVITGLRLDPDSLASVTIGAKPAAVAGYTPRNETDPASLEELRVIVPVSPKTVELLLVHRGGGTAARTLSITQEDVLELESPPVLVEMAEDPYRAEELTIEAPDRDWIRFQLPAGDWTFRVGLKQGYSFQGFAQYRFFLREPSSLTTGDPRWSRHHAGISCDTRGRIWRAERRVGVAEFIVPLRLQEALTVDFVSDTEFGAVVPYRIAMVPGYDSEIPPDAAEGNDFCIHAAPLELDVPHRFTLDTSSDHDWYSFTVPGTPAFLGALPARPEREDNGTFALADTVVPGTRVVGENNRAGEFDTYLVELEAGQLLDVEIHSVLLEEPLPGRNEFSDMEVDLYLYDSGGTPLARSGYMFNPADQEPELRQQRGSDARIRYIAPESGSYYLRLQGESRWINDPPTGPTMYYAMDVRVHEAGGVLQAEALAAGAPSDPEMLLLERRPGDGTAVLVFSTTEGDREFLADPVPPGDYYLVVFGAGGVAGEYSLTLGLDPPAAAAGGGAP